MPDAGKAALRKRIRKQTAHNTARVTPDAGGTARARAAQGNSATALQARADRSRSVTRLLRLQGRADRLVQREVDDRNITQNGTYDARGNLAHDPGVGVPEWAKQDYRSGKGKTGAVDRAPLLDNDFTTPETARNARDPAEGPRLWAVQEYLAEKVTLMASIVDGKIGSIYFDGGRVRTTHFAGPAKSEHDRNRLFQYNIDREAAFQEYAESGDRDRYEGAHPDVHPVRLLNHWIAQRLKGRGATDVPTWAYPLNTVDDALEETDDVDDEGLKLFEVMVKTDGGLGHHPSRGAGVKMNLQLSRAELMMLKKAGELFADKDNPRLANHLFYNYVTRKLPQLLPYIRKPSEISY